MAAKLDISSELDVLAAGNTAALESTDTQVSSQMPSVPSLLWRQEGLKVSLIDELLNRYYIVNEFSWSVTNPLGDQIGTTIMIPSDIFKIFSSDGSRLPNFLDNYAYLRCGVELKLQVNTPRFAVGQLQLSVLYASDLDKNSSLRGSVYQRSQMINAIASAGKNSVAIVRIPFISCFSFLDRNSEYQYSGRMHHNYAVAMVKVLAPLQSDTIIVYGNISARIYDVEVSGMKKYNAPKLSLAIEHQMMSMARLAVSGVEGVLKGVKKEMNQDNPTNPGNNIAVVPMSSHSWCHGKNQVEISNILRLDPLVTAPVRSKESETLLSSIVRQPGLLSIFKWKSSNTKHTKLFSIPVKPLQEPSYYHLESSGSVGTRILETRTIPPIGVISSLFNLWKGSIEFTFDFVTSPIASGRVMIGYVPGVHDDFKVTFEDLKGCNNIVFDLELNTRVTYTVPYYARTPASCVYDYIRKSGKTVEQGNGVLYVMVISPFVSGSTTLDEIQVLVYQRAGLDFELAVPVQPILGLSYHTNYISPTLKVMKVKPSYDGMYCSKWDGYGFGVVNILRHGDGDHMAQFVNMDFDTIYEIQDESINRWKGRGIYIDPYAPDPLPNTNLSVKYKNFFFYEYYLKSKRRTASGNDTYDSAKVYICYVVRAKTKDGFAYAVPFSRKTIARDWIKDNCREGSDLIKFVSNDDLVTQLLGENNEFPAIWSLKSGVLRREFADRLELDKQNKQSSRIIEHQTIERDLPTDILTNVVDPLPSILFNNIGETVVDLKDLLRRYQVYTDSTLYLDRDTCYGQVIARCNVNPTGLFYNSSAGKCLTMLQSRTREGVIPLILSGFRFFRGGTRFRLVITSPTNKDAIFMVTHQPELVNKSDYLKTVKPRRCTDYIASGYASFAQSTRVNEILEFEVPYYLPSERGLLVQMDPTDFFEDDILNKRPYHMRFANMGVISISILQHIEEKTEFNVILYYKLGDDFQVECFNGFPPMTFISAIPDPPKENRVSKTILLPNGNQVPNPDVNQDVDDDVSLELLAPREVDAISNSDSIMVISDCQDVLEDELTTSSYNVVSSNFKNIPVVDHQCLDIQHQTQDILCHQIFPISIFSNEIFNCLLTGAYTLSYQSSMNKLTLDFVNGLMVMAGNFLTASDDARSDPLKRGISYHYIMRTRELQNLNSEYIPIRECSEQDYTSNVSSVIIEEIIDNNTGEIIYNEANCSVVPELDFVHKLSEAESSKFHDVADSIINTSNYVNQTTHDISTEVKSISNKIVTTLSDGIADLVEMLRGYLTAISSGVQNIAKHIFNFVSQVFHVIISPCAATICVSITTLLVNLEIISFDFVPRITSAYNSIIKYLFPSLMPDVVIAEADDIQPQSGALDAVSLFFNFNSIIFKAIASFAGFTVKNSTHIPVFTSILFKDLGRVALSANAIIIFIKNNMVYINRMISYISNLANPSVSLYSTLFDENEAVIAWVKDVEDLCNPCNRQLVETDCNRQFRVAICENIGNVLLQKELRSGCKNFALSAIIRSSHQKISTLYEDLVNDFLIPSAKYEPFVIQLVGPTAIGKSFIADEILMLLLQHLGVRSCAQPIFTRMPGKYWNSVSNQPACKYDEFLFSNTGEIFEQQISDLFCLKSPAVFNPTIAELQNKKKRYAPLILCLISNAAFPALSGVVCKDAIFRRRDIMVKLSLKKEFLNLDSIGVENIPMEVLDKFEHLQFECYKNPGIPSEEETKDFLQPMGWLEFMDHLKNKHTTYHSRELLNYQKRLKNITRLHPEEAPYDINDIVESFNVLKSVQQVEGDMYEQVSKKFLSKVTQNFSDPMNLVTIHNSEENIRANELLKKHNEIFSKIVEHQTTQKKKIFY